MRKRMRDRVMRPVDLSGKRGFREERSLGSLVQDKSRKVRHGWGGRFFRVFYKVILLDQGVGLSDLRVFNGLAQGAGHHGAG